MFHAVPNKPKHIQKDMSLLVFPKKKKKAIKIAAEILLSKEDIYSK